MSAATTGSGAAVSSNHINGEATVNTAVQGIRHWSPRLHVQNMNDMLAAGPLDRAEFWNHFVHLFWTDSPAALRLKFGLSTTGTGSGSATPISERGGSTIEEHDLSTALLVYFFQTWQQASNMKRLQLHLNHVSEGVLPSGFPFLTCANAMVESMGLDGGLLIRQQGRCRMLFDPTGRLVQWELQVVSHDEYFLSLKAGLLVASNLHPLPFSSSANNNNNPLGGASSICPWGFPASIWRCLDLLAVIRELPLPASSLVDQSADNSGDEIAPPMILNGKTLKPLRKRKKNTSNSVAISPINNNNNNENK